jgi:hypothetical protein
MPRDGVRTQSAEGVIATILSHTSLVTSPTRAAVARRSLRAAAAALVQLGAAARAEIRPAPLGRQCDAIRSKRW